MATKTLSTRQMDLAFLFWMAFEVYTETGDASAYARAKGLFCRIYPNGLQKTQASLADRGVIELLPDPAAMVWYVKPSMVAASAVLS